MSRVSSCASDELAQQFNHRTSGGDARTAAGRRLLAALKSARLGQLRQICCHALHFHGINFECMLLVFSSSDADGRQRLGRVRIRRPWSQVPTKSPSEEWLKRSTSQCEFFLQNIRRGSTTQSVRSSDNGSVHLRDYQPRRRVSTKYEVRHGTLCAPVEQSWQRCVQYIEVHVHNR